MGAAEAYMDGSLEVEDLASLTRLFVRNVQVLDKLDGGVTVRSRHCAVLHIGSIAIPKKLT